MLKMCTTSSQLSLSSNVSNSIIHNKIKAINKKPYDVYLGRGKDVAQTLGNRIYRRIINEFQFMYQEATCSKVQIKVATTIVKGIYNLKGNFYFTKNGIWVEASMDRALRRVKQALQGKVRFRHGPHIATTRRFLVDVDDDRSVKHCHEINKSNLAR